jgi:cell division transport system permease protein
MDGAVADLGRLYGGAWQLTPLSGTDALSLLGFSAALGWLGAWLSVARHLVYTRIM